ncbi:MAG: four helix bundle protein [Candidatus Curtissbacteria bacterium]|nr:four helix bundle protein [Candidatus Curtissbacteria bacterium]
MRGNTEKDVFKRRPYQFTLDLIKFTEGLPKDRVVDVIVKQLIRCGTSVCANYVEAYAASSKRDYANFFSYSLKSANESKFWNSLLRDTGKADKEDAQVLLDDELDQISRILGSSLITLRRKDAKN